MMELFQIEVTGFRKFKSKATLKTRGKVLAILGANEAGKSSLLKALVRLNDTDAFEPDEISRGADPNAVKISAKFLISDAERELIDLPQARWFNVTKNPDGAQKWMIDPWPADRDYSHRPKLKAEIEKIQANQRAVEAMGLDDEGLLNETVQFCTKLSTSEKDLSDAEKNIISNLSERWALSFEQGAPKYLLAFSDRLAAAVKIEQAESKRIAAGSKLWKKLPEFLFFGDQDRDLKSSYAWSDLTAGIPPALENLAKVAEIDLNSLMVKMSADANDPAIDTIVERANATLKSNFQTVWKQSAISVVLSAREQRLLVQVYNNQGERTALAQRSDGLRQFVALRCFTAAREAENFVLVIDEAEQHLHYDAQADLVQMLASQTVAAKVIYTTHSIGCLPEDLGNGVRLVEPISKDSDWSKIENKFWSEKKNQEAAFSPILMGMGASTMAFFPTRSAVLVEGPADTILLPTMFREALKLESLGVQFVHGLSEDGRMQLPLLNSTGRQVCYLLDNDAGGRTLRVDLEQRLTKTENIFSLISNGGDCELEDFIDSDLLEEAACKLAFDHLKIDKLIAAKSMPRNAKWDHIEQCCKQANVNVLSKVEVAYAVLSILDENPSRRILDQNSRAAFKKVAEKVVGALIKPVGPAAN